MFMDSLLASCLISASALASQPMMHLSSDAASYSAGTTAHLEVRALVAPQQTEDDFFIASTINGVEAPVIQSTNGLGIVLAPLAQAGSYVWAVQLFLENAKLAASLNFTVRSLRLQNDHIATELGQTTDPTQIAALEAHEAANNAQISEASQELSQIRRPFGESQSLSFTAQ